MVSTVTPGRRGTAILGWLMAENGQERKKTQATRKADAEARAAQNARLAAEARAAGKPPPVNDKLVAKARPAKSKRKKLPSAIPTSRDSRVRRQQRDAEYRKALGLGSDHKLPSQLGNPTSGGGGRDRAKAARPTRKGGDVQFARRARLIG